MDGDGLGRRGRVGRAGALGVVCTVDGAEVGASLLLGGVGDADGLPAVHPAAARLTRPVAATATRTWAACDNWILMNPPWVCLG